MRLERCLSRMTFRFSETVTSCCERKYEYIHRTRHESHATSLTTYKPKGIHPSRNSPAWFIDCNKNTDGGKHALVFGASGITGWAIVNGLLTDHADAKKFSTISALTNRPFPSTISRWPESSKLHLISGIDLLKGSVEDLQEAMKSQIQGVDTVTHIFFNGQPDKH